MPFPNLRIQRTDDRKKGRNPRVFKCLIRNTQKTRSKRNCLNASTCHSLILLLWKCPVPHMFGSVHHDTKRQLVFWYLAGIINHQANVPSSVTFRSCFNYSGVLRVLGTVLRHCPAVRSRVSDAIVVETIQTKCSSLTMQGNAVQCPLWNDAESPREPNCLNNGVW